MKRIAVLAAVTVAAAAFFGWHWWASGRFMESTDNAYVEADIAVIAPRVAGYVREVRVRDNQPVRRGTVLVLIEDRDLTARLSEARSRHTARLASLESIEREARLQFAAVARAAADIDSAAAEQERAALDLARYEELAKAKLISLQRVELARIEARKAQAFARSARATLNVERRRADVIAARRAEVNAAVEEARAAVVQAEFERDSAVVRAPMDGVVGNRTVRVGQYVRAGSPLMAIAPLTETYVVANFKETQLERMRPGQAVAIELDAFPEHRLSGTIDSVAPAAGSRFALLPPENATGNFTRIVQRIPVRVRLAAEHSLAGRLRPGMSVVATVDTR